MYILCICIYMCVCVCVCARARAHTHTHTYTQDIFFDSVPIVLVGNKTDLYVDRMITTDQGKRLASSWNAAFLETSAKQNEVSRQILFPLRLIKMYMQKIKLLL